MTDHKFTGEEIIKALECCLNGNVNKSQVEVCSPCPFFHDGNCTDLLKQNALTLINRQKAEIERLIKANNRDDLQHKYCDLIEDVLVYSKSLEDYNKFRKSFKAEAIKEFAERAKEKMQNLAMMEYGNDEIYFLIGKSFIDNLVKEMTEK